MQLYTEKYVKYTDFVQKNTDHILMRLEALVYVHMCLYIVS